MRHLRIVAAICASAAASSAATPAPKDAAMWTIYVTNDNCPDYTLSLIHISEPTRPY